jgi:non-ribosomal peptide synthetase component F
MKIGASYVPLDPSYPHERIEFMIEDSGLEVIISDSTLVDYISSFKTEIIQIDTIQDLESLDGSNFKNSAGPRDLAYTIYTSGSTGKPKGVQIEHRSLMNFLYSMKKTPALPETTGCAR